MGEVPPASVKFGCAAFDVTGVSPVGTVTVMAAAAFNLPFASQTSGAPLTTLFPLAKTATTMAGAFSTRSGKLSGNASFCKREKGRSFS